MPQTSGEVAAPCKPTVAVHDDGEVVDLEWMFLNFTEKLGFDRLAEHIPHAF